MVATGQLALVAVASAIATATGVSPSGAVAGAAIATAIIILFASRPTIRFGAVPRWTLAIEATAAAVLIGSFSAFPSQSMIWLIGKIVIAGIATLLIAWRGDFLMPRRHD